MIKFEKEFDELDANRVQSLRKGRKYALEPDDNGLLKEYEYNLDYTMDDSIRLTDADAKEINRMKSETNYLSMLLNEDNVIKQRLSRSTGNHRRSKELNLGKFFLIVGQLVCFLFKKQLNLFPFLLHNSSN